MNIQEACNILGIELGASPDEAKKAFRKKAAEYHPDKNQSEGAEAKFKEINAAYQLVEKHGTVPQTQNVGSEFYDHGDHLAEEIRRRMNINFGFGRPNYIRSEPIIVSIDIPFEVAVLGGSKDVTYERTIKCEACNAGKVETNKVKCKKCDGKGHRKYGEVNKELPCTTCGGSGYTCTKSSCRECNESGIRKSVRYFFKVTIPPGMESGVRLILKGKGNYNALIGQYDNVIAVISVTPDSHDMHLDNGE